MPVIPHAFRFFDSAGLLLRSDAASFTQPPTEWEMPPDEACRYLDAIGRFIREDRRRKTPAFVSPLVVSFMGGEPLADLPVLDRLLSAVESHGLAAEVWTAASWVRDRAHAAEVFSTLHGRVHAVRLQTSSRILDEERVAAMLEAARAEGILMDVHCGIAPELPFPRRLLALEVINNGTSFVHADPAYEELPADRTSLPDDDGFFLRSVTGLRCAEKFGFFVAPGGPVYPCVAGVGCPELRIGDLATQEISDIVGAAVQNPELRRLHDRGPRGMAPYHGRWVDNCDYHRQVLARAGTGTDT